MHNRAPAVTFKRQSLEKWMEIFATHDWQKSFPSDVVREGVQFFESCNIKEIEIRPEDIVVRYHSETRSPIFALIDLEDSVLSARSSLANDPRPAVAALLAMDEVILDKQGALFAPDNETNTSSEKTDNGADEDSENLEKVLKLSFYMSGQNLCFKAYWIRDNKLVFPDNLSSRNNVLSQRERDHVVKLIHLARKANFTLFKQSKEYRMANISLAIDFCRYHLSKWNDYFTLQLDPLVQKLLPGIQEVHAHFIAKSVPEESNTVDLSLQFSNGTFTIEGNDAKKLTRSNGDPIFIEGVGVVRVARS